MDKVNIDYPNLTAYQDLCAHLAYTKTQLHFQSICAPFWGLGKPVWKKAAVADLLVII